MLPVRHDLHQQNPGPAPFLPGVGVLRLRSCFPSRTRYFAQDDGESDTILGMERRSVVEYLASFLRRGRECAYVQHRGYRAERWSYRQVAETAFRFARELERRGIGKGERVLLWGPNSAEWVAVFFGCALRGAIVVPIDEAGAADFTQRVYQQVDAKLLVGSRAHVLPSIPVLALEDLPEILSAHAAAPYEAAAIGPADVLEIVFTSGTTAEPKGVVITHGNVLGNIAPLETEIRKYLKYERLVHPVRFLNLLPLSHVFGQFLGIFLPQLMGGTVIFQDALNPGEVIRDDPARARLGAGGGAAHAASAEGEDRARSRR